MKVLLVSDQASRYIWDFFDRRAFEGVEMILSCGDLPASYLEFLVTMLGVPLYYVPGNHDKRFQLHPPEGCTCIDGQLIVAGGFRILGFGGCRSGRRALYEYLENDMARRVSRIKGTLRCKKGFDILLTHAPAFGLGDGKDLFHQGFECFRSLLETYEPRYHIFGHQHKNYDFAEGITQFGNTRLINAYGYHILELV